MFEHGVAHAQFEKHVPDWMDVVDNSAEDIALGLEEMLDEMDGALGIERKAHNTALRRRYDEILSNRGQFAGSPICGGFLQRYSGLLDH